MSEEQLASFDSALHFAFGGCPPTAGAASPFAVGAPAPAGMEAAAAGAVPTTPLPTSPFTQGGSFANAGLSPFPGTGPASASEQAQRRAEALTSLKLRLEAQKLKCGAVGLEAMGLREAARKAAEAGGSDVAETEQLASFDSALRFAFGGCPATAGVASFFAVGAPAPAGMEAVAAGAAPTTPSPTSSFTQGGSFASAGL